MEREKNVLFLFRILHFSLSLAFVEHNQVKRIEFFVFADYGCLLPSFGAKEILEAFHYQLTRMHEFCFHTKLT